MKQKNFISIDKNLFGGGSPNFAIKTVLMWGNKCTFVCKNNVNNFVHRRKNKMYFSLRCLHQTIYIKYCHTKRRKITAGGKKSQALHKSWSFGRKWFQLSCMSSMLQEYIGLFSFGGFFLTRNVEYCKDKVDA